MKKIDLEKLSSIVSKRRKERDMTQDQLGELTGINRQVIGRIELGKTVPSLNQLQQLLDVLEIDFDSILEDKQTEDVFMAMRGEARTAEERKGLETMISMMLCLKKHEQLRRVYNG
ncbi:MULTISPECIES: helix-turn-helix transcriptional regulator [unclassified Clostridium]|uniref:helix-turn-helix transcriptional regulator n=1 Tax=unclassified Clostridium TaxID=2614128 RepID=UPI003218064F